MSAIAVNRARAGRKRRVPQPNRTAREKLLEYVGGDGSVDYMGEDARKHTRTVRRLLRDYLREFVAKACDEARGRVRGGAR